ESLCHLLRAPFYSPPTPSPDLYTLSLHDALPISPRACRSCSATPPRPPHEGCGPTVPRPPPDLPRRRTCSTGFLVVRIVRIGGRSEEHTSELQSRENLVCRLLLEKKKTTQTGHSE